LLPTRSTSSARNLDRAADAAPVQGRYQGRRGAIRASTSHRYQRHLELYWLPAIGRRSLSRVNAPDLSRVVATLAARGDDEYLTDASLRRIFAPMGALLATAVEEGLIPHNPARDVRLPSGRDELRRFDPDAADDSDDPSPGRARSLTQEQLETLLEVVDARWRTLFELLAATGLRISEALALRWRASVSMGTGRLSSFAGPTSMAPSGRLRAVTAAGRCR
jgi:integrase